MGMIKPGVIFGEDYLKLIAQCKMGQYALPAVNVVGTNSINAVLEAAASCKSDVIIQLSNGGAQFFAGLGMADKAQAKVLGAVSAARHVHMLAQHYGIGVVLNTDHADRGLIPWVDALINASQQEIDACGRPLFTSHMLDLSQETLEDNISLSAERLQRLHALDMSLEIELGITGGEEDGVGTDEENYDNPALYTNEQDVLYAWQKLSPIGHFSLAASFGNVHGVYAPGNVKLRPDILQKAQKAVELACNTAPKPLDLVFHGGSGSALADIHEAISYGVFKMNIDTDTQFAFATAIGDYVEQHPKAFKWQTDPETSTPYKKQYDPRKWLRSCETSMVQRLKQTFDDLRATNRSLCI